MEAERQFNPKKIRQRKKTPSEVSPKILAALKSDEIRNSMREVALSKKAKRKSAKLEHEVCKIPMSMKAQAGAHLSNPLNAMRPFKVTLTDPVITAVTSATGGVGAAFNMQLDQLPGYTDYVNLFDQYRITKIRLEAIPRANTNTLTVMSNAATQTLSPIAVTWDPDDSTTPASADEVLQYPTARVFPGYKPFKYTYKPRAAIAAYGGAFTQFADFDGWCDCASDDVEWYALKVWQFGSGASQTTFQIWDFFFVTELEFRFVR